MAGKEGEAWDPKTRDDWVEMFADSLGLHQSRLDEAAAKAAQEKKDKPEGGTDGGEDNPPKRSFAERVLGK